MQIKRSGAFSQIFSTDAKPAAIKSWIITVINFWKEWGKTS
jgi:hypothetical protein